jgi:hypothetical protein
VSQLSGFFVINIITLCTVVIHHIGINRFTVIATRT